VIGTNNIVRDSTLGASNIQSSSSLFGSSSAQEEPETLELFSPCKINLFLRIIRKREDGFHDLASLFQAIGFGDTLELTPLPETDDDDDDDDESSADEFTCNMPGVPVDSTNLVIRALELMREKTGVQMYFKTNLIKKCPAQAGLGGGSANAATAMWGANELMGRPASVEQVSNHMTSLTEGGMFTEMFRLVD
jgi:4-diphosphocytidyl-2-C-methyl-D-erythritol kinase